MKIIWDKVGDRLFETGVSNGVLYPQDKEGKYPLGVPWNGLTAITESPSGGEPNPFYADNIKYFSILSAEEYGATIEAFYYPKEFNPCNGVVELEDGISIGQQKRQRFGLVYKTLLGNDIEEESYGYKLHIVYGAQASPSEKNHQTVNATPEPLAFSWEVSTTPVEVSGYKPTATLEIDSTTIEPDILKKIEAQLFGSDGTPAEGETPAVDPIQPHLLLPDEIAALIAQG